MTQSASRPGEDQWYLRRGEDVRGPFPWAAIARHAGLGRIHPSDLLSRDRREWRPSRELLPLLHEAASDGAAEVEPPPASRRSGVVADRHPARVPLLAVALALGLCAALAVHGPPSRGTAQPDCRAAAGPGINWEYCRFEQAELAGANLAGLAARNVALRNAHLAGARLVAADLAYADLRGADLTLADVAQARLVGASLRDARLNHARLTGADLRNADLRGASVAGAQWSAARLGGALWVDGRVCPPEAVGACAAP
ncbi:MAG: pentapeptide repeat-containing protein [Gammaproteobacteria bacterium]